jgi:NADH:ubiquinone oxidoreductase subunit 5 (subunit L)/multisubunit Na+/H+ antiporter MnhA subunit
LRIKTIYFFRRSYTYFILVVKRVESYVTTSNQGKFVTIIQMVNCYPQRTLEDKDVRSVIITFLFECISLLFMGFIFIISSLVILYRDYYMFGDLNIVRFDFVFHPVVYKTLNYETTV